MWFSCFWHCLVSERGRNGFGRGWVEFGHDGGIVEWLGVGGGREHVSRCIVASNCCWRRCGCAKVGGGTSGTLRRIFGLAPSHLMWKQRTKVAHDIVIDGARFSYQVSAVQIKIFAFFGLGKVRHGLQSLFKHFEECKGVFSRAKITVKHVVEHFRKIGY